MHCIFSSTKKKKTSALSFKEVHDKWFSNPDRSKNQRKEDSRFLRSDRDSTEVEL